FPRPANGGLQGRPAAGFQINPLLYARNALANRAPYVTANINLWPQMDVLLANPGRLGALTEQERGGLRQSAQDAAARSTSLADRDAQSVRSTCEAGARFATASP